MSTQEKPLLKPESEKPPPKPESHHIGYTKDHEFTSDIARTFSQKSAQMHNDIKNHKKKAGGDDDGTEINITEHEYTIEQTAQAHNTDIERGLTTAAADAALHKFGANELTPPATVPAWLQFFHHLTGFFSLLLWLAAALCFLGYGLDSKQVENLYLGIVLAAVTVLTGMFSYYQDAKSQAVMAGFKNMLPPETIVVRDGSDGNIPAREVVPGDIVKIRTGQRIPADIRVILAVSFKVDNASLTGESEAQQRTADICPADTSALEATNLAFYGTCCTTGTATGIVIRTSDKTVIGTIAKLATSTDNIETPIAQEIAHFIHIVSGVAVFLGVTFLIIGFVKGTPPIANLVFAIGIIVANVPEGLLATVTVALTLTAKRMAIKQVLVKNLEAVETLGSTTVIASDKTGTLTQNRMTVAHVYYNNTVFQAAGDVDYDKNDPTFKRLHEIACLCNTAAFKNSVKNLKLPVLERETNGDASESAFIKFVEPLHPILDMRAQNKTIATVPFNSHNKYQVAITMMGNDPNAPRLLLMKGAPERVYHRCDTVLINGKPQPITPEITAAFHAGQRQLMQGGERVLGMASLELDPEKFPMDEVFYNTDPEFLEGETYNFPMGQTGEDGKTILKGQGLCFTGLISLIDPPRAAVPSAVKSCQAAGIKVIMVTGDHPDTAEAIAKEVGIITGLTQRDIANRDKVTKIEDIDPDHPEITACVITGAMLAEMSDAQLQEVLDYEQVVFARTSPKQKLIIVQGLQNKMFIRRGYPADNPRPVRHVVAVTGDGVNDSPALKAADIGVAMGIVGSDVAKDAADMILLNDNFASIVDGVEEGRLIFDNLKKSIAYTLSSNIPEISPFLVFILVNVPLPLPTVLILCIDLGTDMVPAISLAYENKESNIMLKPPRDMNTERLVTAKLVSFSYLQVGVIQALAGFYSYFVVLNDYGFPPNILPNLATAFYNINVWSDDTHPDQPKRNGGIPYINYRPMMHKDDTPGSTEGFVFLSPCNIINEMCHKPELALQHAQTAFFISIIIVQWADIVACKTRTLSLRTQGMRNIMLNFGLLFETVLGALLCYVTPLNGPLGTAPLVFLHFGVPAIPFAVVILMYDEIRKYLLRSLGEKNWVERNTYY